MSDHMDITDLDRLGEALLTDARAAASGRASRTVVGSAGSLLHQTLLALVAGEGLAEHGNPGEATLLVLRGHAAVQTDDEVRAGVIGTLIVVPDAPHSVVAREDSLLLLTVTRER